MQAEAGGKRVVVGIDGSPASYAALRWAVDYARMAGAGVEAVAAYDVAGGIGWSAPAVDAALDAEEARRKLGAEIRDVLGTLHDVPVEEHMVRGNAVEALITASEGAELLVVGNRGRGGFARLLLGSVSQQCALHASCPVVILRAPEDGRDAAAKA
ncbi:universal stress protein [Streptomyces sp. NPDC014870]|uniref:universal stress protein n=1 Tax=Streptomyces sp. NPDC014870 TaxID=3364925 RepID=UPI0036FF1601